MAEDKTMSNLLIISQLRQGVHNDKYLIEISSFFKWAMDGLYTVKSWHSGIHVLDEWCPLDMPGHALSDEDKRNIDEFSWIKEQNKIGLLAIGSAGTKDDPDKDEPFIGPEELVTKFLL